MRIVSWNVDYWQRGARSGYWDSIMRTLREAEVDVVLLQETSPVFDQEFAYEELTRQPGGATRGWGSAVLPLNPEVTLKRIPWVSSDGHVPLGSYGCTHPGTIAAAEISFGKHVLNVVSVYGRMFSGGNNTTYASTTMHRVISDLVPFLDRSARSPELVIGGDFNCTKQWGRPRDRAMDGTVFDRLAAHGTVELLRDRYPNRQQLDDCSCVDADGCYHVRTLRHRDRIDSRPIQDDYLFASDSLAAHCTAFVLDTDDVWAISDHCIVGIDVDLDRL